MAEADTNFSDINSSDTSPSENSNAPSPSSSQNVEDIEEESTELFGRDRFEFGVRKEMEQPKGGSLSFLQLYSSLMILLMTFFIVLVSLSKVSLDKFEEVKGGLSDSFAVFGIANEQGRKIFIDTISQLSSVIDRTKLEHKDGSAEKKEDIKGATKEQEQKNEEGMKGVEGEEGKKKEGVKEKPKEEEKSEDLFKKEAIEKDKFFEKGYSQLKIMASDEMIFLGGEVEKKGKELYIRLPSKNIFYPGDIQVMPASLEPLRTIIDLLKEEEFARITVRCFTDEQPVSELSDYSYLGLSCLRGNRIGRFFREVGGIPAKKIRNLGFGNARHSKGKVFNNSIELVIN